MNRKSPTSADSFSAWVTLSTQPSFSATNSPTTKLAFLLRQPGRLGLARMVGFDER